MKKVLILVASLFFCSCNEKQEVKWRGLNQLDELSIKVEHATQEHKHDEQAELLGEAKTLIPQIASSIPANAKNKDQVKVLLTDLTALAEQLNELESLEHEQLDTLSKSIHPIVAKLMESAGVPHVHKSSCSEEHDASSCNDPTHNH